MNLPNLWQLISSYKFKSLFIRNLIITLTLVGIPLIVSNSFVYHNLNQNYKNDINEQNENLFNTVVNRVSTLYSDTNRLATQLTLQDDVQTYMYTHFYPNEGTDKTRDLIKMYTNTYAHIDSILLYSELKNEIITNGYSGSVQNFSDKSWLGDDQEIEKNETRISLRKYNDFYPYLISFNKPVFLNDQKYGMVIVNLNIRELKNIIENSSGNYFEDIFIIDNRTNQVIYHKDQTYFQQLFSDVFERDDLEDEILLIDDGIIEKDDVIVSKQSLDVADWTIVTTLFLDRFAEQKETIRQFFIMNVVFSAVVAIVISLIITIQTYMPIEKVISVLDRPDQNHLNQKKISENELMYIYQKIKHNYDDKLDMSKELTNNLKLLNDAQMVAMQAQISPHFLSNALETMRWNAMLLTGDENDVAKMAISLSKLLRLTLGSDTGIQSLRTEIELAEQYIYIMQMRFKDQFEVEWQVDEQLLDYQTILLLLQPLIENAINHGLRTMKEKGLIKVILKENKDHIELVVADNGIGMEKAKLDLLRAHLKEDVNLSGKHVGVRNVNHRIRLMFGEKFGVQVFSDKGIGTSVIVSMPKYKNDQ